MNAKPAAPSFLFTAICTLLLFGMLGFAGPAWSAAPDAAQIKRGEYVARLGDCFACHTSGQGAAMAGGLELKTPFGTIYSTNITPDPVTGIGKYSFEQFNRAMRKGVAADGHHLYPAMPYPSYAKITPDDMQALYVYLQHGVAPVVQKNRENDMKWPFSMRWGLYFWNALFLKDEPFKPDASKSATWNRGSYLAQGLGHCGSCHTPRGVAFQEKTMGQDGPKEYQYLAGFTFDTWHAVNLRNLWTPDDIVQLLKTGRNSFGTAAGSMTEVITHSTQYFTDTDLAALAEYLHGLPPNKSGGPAPRKPLVLAQATEAALYTTRGGLGYTQFCATCHRRDGRGVDNIFPPLAQNHSVQSKDPTLLIHIALTGWQSAVTQHSPRSFGMPAYDSLSNEELAEILSFVRGSWGNKGEVVTVSQVARVRKELKLKPTSSDFSTPRFAALMANANAEQLMRGMQLMTETKARLPKNVGNDLNCSSCHLNGGTVAKGSPFLGISAFFPLEAPRAGRVISLAERINGCFKRSMNGSPLPAGTPDLQAMVAYIDWMKGATQAGDNVPGRGVAKIDRSLVPNAVNGKKIFAQQCAVCHGDYGQGIKGTDGVVAFPPLWGERSFNIGAGMARTYTAAGFVKANMVMGHGQKFPLGQGNLSDQDAVDVAEYFTHMPRPDFPEKVHDWPKGGKPKDARY
ncbi:thiosulfate dehydrogenase [Janthinobacterium sp. K2Li3]|nr:thiosulfate dehydrogenase [Janthinobacterium sp. K2C7]MBB5379918.1 thiosulfate dehydrogenase [Janthinobacterium sp. K2Li3]MBB5385986.1 thiosulfate dehydrogenase [Janthinobacterium sp. K2E3]